MPLVNLNLQNILQKIAELETKIHRIEVNVEVNGLSGNETTLPWNQNSRQEPANTRLISPDNDSTKQEFRGLDKKPRNNHPCWNTLGAKPKVKSFLGERVTGRAQRPEICDATGWPALSSEKSASSTPVPKRKQPWTTVKTKSKSVPTQITKIQLENRFAPLYQDRASSPSMNKERYETKSKSKRSQKELMTGPQTLIVGDVAVKEVNSFCSKKNTNVLCFTNDMVSDISEKILDIVAEHPTAKSLILHTGACDVVKQQSEVLKQDFTDLLNKVRSLDTVVFVSGPLPTVRRGDERFSRLLMLNRWLKATCAAQSVNFIDNFNIFWERRHLFKADGFCLNKSGVRLLTSNIFYSVHHTPVPPFKDTRQNKLKQLIRQPLEGEILVPEISFEQTSQLCQEEESLLPSSPRKEESPPVATRGNIHSPPTPTNSPPSPASLSLSPSSPLLDFTDEMKKLVNVGLRLTPRPNLPRLKPPSPKRHRAPPPPPNNLWPLQSENSEVHPVHADSTINAY